jgi:hypothetical protein
MKKLMVLLGIQLAVIPVVILIFKIPYEKRVLSLLANAVFVMVGIATLSYGGYHQWFIRMAGLQFLATAVLPITILRIISWEADFNTSSLLGITGAQWHRYSNISFSLLVGMTLLSLILRKVNSHQIKRQAS